MFGKLERNKNLFQNPDKYNPPPNYYDDISKTIHEK